jgi:DNA-binding transcriptional LysR family regulator
MELRHLRYFVAVAEELHFSRAAERLGIAQPPLSQQIRQLEDEIGVRLFNRGSRRIELTEAGTTLLEEARQILRHVDKAVRATNSTGHGKSGRLAIGFVGSAMADVLPTILRAFRQRHPRVELELEHVMTPLQIEAIRSGRFHVGFGRPPIKDESLEVVTVVKEHLLAALPSDHPLASRSRISLKAIADEPFIMVSRLQATSLHDQLIALCRQCGFSPKIAQEAMPYQTITSLVAAGLGVALVPSTVKAFARKGVSYIQLQEQPRNLEIVMFWQKSATPSPVLRSFLEVAQQVVRRPRKT